jgi:hypothetical protein
MTKIWCGVTNANVAGSRATQAKKKSNFHEFMQRAVCFYYGKNGFEHYTEATPDVESTSIFHLMLSLSLD